MEGCSSDNLESIEEQLFEGLKLKSQEEATVVLLRTMMLRLDSLHDLACELRSRFRRRT
jgi:hypothetical protein